MIRTRWINACLTAACVVIGCSPAATNDKPAIAAQPPPVVAPASAPPISPAPPSTTATEPAPPPAAPGKDAKETMPAGLSPISDAEAQEADTKCKPLGDALKQAASKDKEASKSPVEFSLKFLAEAPKLKGVDVQRCAELMRRDLLVYRAKTIESMAIQHLTVLAISLQSAYAAQPPVLCPKAGPTPTELSAVQDKAYSTKPEDWTAEGWKCVRFLPMPAVRYQYELRTDPKALTYEVIARGYPVKGGPVSELYLPGKVGPGAPDKPNAVLRR